MVDVDSRRYQIVLVLVSYTSEYSLPRTCDECKATYIQHRRDFLFLVSFIIIHALSFIVVVNSLHRAVPFSNTEVLPHNSNHTWMVFPNIEDIVENIVDEVFLDKLTEEGYYDYDGLPKNFAKLALVSRNFVNAVRRNIYTELLVDGPERFLLLTGQLRSSPHLAKLVKRASLNSSCNERAHIDGFESGTPGDGEPRTVSITALKWFLEACPQLSKLELHGGDFLDRTARVQSPSRLRLAHGEGTKRSCQL
ncbi:hypothetical protein B0H10DRAFT_1120325 [Mycena sp. CBHHK59/15]|nr:hypothetical protein B0H10DRAFT_1120325 [Mycena sp. CBHHK59/15]